MGASAESRLSSLRALQAADVNLLSTLRGRISRAKSDGHAEIQRAAERQLTVVEDRTKGRLREIVRLEAEIRNRPGGH